MNFIINSIHRNQEIGVEGEGYTKNSLKFQLFTCGKKNSISLKSHYLNSHF